MRKTAYAHAALTHKYGKGCCDVAEHKIFDDDGEITGFRLEVLDWDEDIASIPQPDENQLLQDIEEYIANVLPAKQQRQEKINKIKAVLSDDDIVEIVIGLAKDNPSSVPLDIRAKVQEALRQ